MTEGVWERMDTCICMTESCYSPEIITVLLIGYTQTQNVFGIKKIKFNLKKSNVVVNVNSC